MYVAAHQPLFLPPISYFYKMSKVAVFISADDLQYTTHGNINRSRIKTPAGALWLTVPVLHKSHYQTPINAMHIDNHAPWATQIVRTLQLHCQNTPYFDLYFDTLRQILLRPWVSLVELNQTLIDFLKSHLFLKNELLQLSKFPRLAHTNQRLIHLLREIKAQGYVVESQDRPWVPVTDFHQAGLEVIFYDYQPPYYYQSTGAFLPDLSVIDLLFNEGPYARRFLAEAVATPNQATTQ
ncbi:WbqC family protein, partial [candidate division KSB1 bacterium]|nr:WbqC family protein [candidate division KSB1 bacterium]